MKIFLYLLFAITGFFLSIYYSYSTQETALLCVTFVTSAFVLIRMKTMRDNVFILLILLYIFFSVQIVALFQLSSYGFYINIISDKEYERLALWGNHLFFVVFSVLAFFSIFQHKKKSNIATIETAKSKDFAPLLKFCSILVVFLQIVSLIFGLAGNQEDARMVLPFHLNGIIDEYRATIYPFIFVVYLYDRLSGGGKIERKWVIVYIIYALLEVFVRNSKGSLLISFAPVLLICFYMGQINKRFAARYIVPLFMAVVMLYPVVENARSYGQISFETLFSSANNLKNVDETEKSSPYIRTFLTGCYYMKCDSYVSKNEFEFDFHNVPMLLALRGGAAYMTRIIDGVPDTVHHSSGVTGLCDALLWGGYPMCYFITIILTILAVWADKSILFNKNILYKIIFFGWFYQRLMSTTISFFIDNLFLPSVVSLVLEIFIANYYTKNYCKKRHYGDNSENLHISYANNK